MRRLGRLSVRVLVFVFVRALSPGLLIHGLKVQFELAEDLTCPNLDADKSIYSKSAICLAKHGFFILGAQLASCPAERVLCWNILLPPLKSHKVLRFCMCRSGCCLCRELPTSRVLVGDAVSPWAWCGCGLLVSILSLRDDRPCYGLQYSIVLLLTNHQNPAKPTN